MSAKKVPQVKPKADHRILVVDDHPLVRDGLVELIQRQPGLTCCGEAADIRAAQELAAITKPDLVTIDLRLEKSDGLELIRFFNSQYPALRLLVISQLDENLYAARVLKGGAHGYLMKDQAAQEVVAAIRLILAGEIYVSPKMNSIILRRMMDASTARPRGGAECLTERELQVFEMLGAGKSTRRIATELFLSFKTVQTHRENIKAKMGLPDAAALIHRAVISHRQGSLELPNPSNVAQ